MWLFRSSFVLLAYVLLVIYTGFRIFALIKNLLPKLRAFIFWPIYVFFGFSYFLVFFLRLDRVWTLRQIVNYSLPFLVYFFFSLLIFEAARIFYRIKKRERISPRISALFTGIALSLAVLAMVYGAVNARSIRSVHYEVVLNGTVNPDLPLRIALVSDTHFGRTVDRKWTSKIVDAVNKTNPGIIILAGDIFDNNIEMIPDLEGLAYELRRLKAPLGVYACQGNHDIDRISLREEGRTDRIEEFLEGVGINFLLDRVVLVADSFYLAGRRDVRVIGSRHVRMTAAELAAGLDKNKPLIFMDHQPVDFPGMEEAGAALILSGHTHKGQFFPGNIVTAGMFKNAGAVHYGYWQGKSAKGVVTSGAGVWGPPIRIGTRSEVAVVDVIFK